MQYEVTIGIPVYRAAGYIEKTMESALSQTFPSIEFLVLDDCGGDGSMDVIERLQKEHPRGKDIRILRHEKNYGIGVARNRILDEARGNYLFFLDSDDIIMSDTIQLLFDHAQKIDAEIVYGSWERIDVIDKTPSVQSVYPYMLFTEPDGLAMYAFKNYSTFRISVCNCLMKISTLRDAHLHFVDAIFWEDMAFTYEMVTKVRRAILLPEITYYYICRPDSLSHFQERKTLHKEEILKNASVVNYLKDKLGVLRGHSYVPYMNYNLGMNSFYVVCYVLKHQSIIHPMISNSELRQLMQMPLKFSDIICRRGRLMGNLALWTLSHIPNSLFVPFVRIAGKIKKVI